MLDTAVLSNDVISLAAGIQKKLGPGLFKKTYIRCLAFELRKLGYKVDEELPLPGMVSNNVSAAGQTIDLLIEDTLVLDLINEEKLLPQHELELLWALRTVNKQIGLLINFNQTRLHEGIKKIKLN